MSSELLQKERHARIFDLLGRKGRVLAGDLAGMFGVSEDTVRRDLREMAAAGQCERVYGGALAISPQRLPIATRMTQAADRKAELAQGVVALVERRMTIFIDAGSTNLAIAQALPEDHDLTMITNAPAIALALSGREGIEIIMIGGSFDRNTGANLGARTLAEMAMLLPDMTMIGACGADPEAGLTAAVFEDAQIKRMAVANSRLVLAALTTEKFSLRNPHVICRPDAINYLVVENTAPEGGIRQFASRGISIRLVGKP